MALRTALIASAVSAFDGLSDTDISQLILTPPIDVYQKIRKILQTAFRNGQFQVTDELIKQGAEIDALIVDASAETEEQIGTIADLTVANAVNEIQSRAINQIVSFGILGLTAIEIARQLGDALSDQSDAWVEDTAGSSVNASTQHGRDKEMIAREEIIKVYIYSAILDKNLCKFCKRWDGESSKRRDDLPMTPNPKCLGRQRCRCFVIAVFGGEDFIADENEVR